VDVVNPLEKTPWGTYRFVIKDTGGNTWLLGQIRIDHFSKIKYCDNSKI
jgi:uncharacterized glyoxalase superfamily protein PhnB